MAAVSIGLGLPILSWLDGGLGYENVVPSCLLGVSAALLLRHLEPNVLSTFCLHSIARAIVVGVSGLALSLGSWRDGHDIPRREQILDTGVTFVLAAGVAFLNASIRPSWRARVETPCVTRFRLANSVVDWWWHPSIPAVILVTLAAPLSLAFSSEGFLAAGDAATPGGGPLKLVSIGGWIAISTMLTTNLILNMTSSSAHARAGNALWVACRRRRPSITIAASAALSLACALFWSRFQWILTDANSQELGRLGDVLTFAASLAVFSLVSIAMTLSGSRNRDVRILFVGLIVVVSMLGVMSTGLRPGGDLVGRRFSVELWSNITILMCLFLPARTLWEATKWAVRRAGGQPTGHSVN